MNFADKQTTRKGALGEKIAKRHLESRGFIVYVPQTDGAHLESGFRSPGWLLTQKIEAVTGISREKLRPDIFGEYKAA